MKEENISESKKSIIERLFVNGHLSFNEMYTLMKPDCEIIVNSKKDIDIKEIIYNLPPSTTTYYTTTTNGTVL